MDVFSPSEGLSRDVKARLSVKRDEMGSFDLDVPARLIAARLGLGLVIEVALSGERCRRCGLDSTRAVMNDRRADRE